MTEARLKRKESEDMTDEEIIVKEKSALIEDEKHYKESKAKCEEDKIKLESYLAKAQNYKPPTEQHEGVCEFMQEQLKITMDWDSNYYDKGLRRIADKTKNLNADDIRSEIKIQATKDISYHTRGHEEEMKR